MAAEEEVEWARRTVKDAGFLLLLQHSLLPKMHDLNLFFVIGLNLNLARLPPQHD
jgi:hypothetical protein